MHYSYIVHLWSILLNDQTIFNESYLKPTDMKRLHVTVLVGHVESLASQMQSFPYNFSCR